MNEPKPKPKAFCFVCKKYYLDSSVINKNCRSEIGDKKCKGLIRSALSPDDWKICTVCQGSGIDENDKCFSCQGTGWILSR